MSDLWVLRQHCMKIRYDSVMEVTARAQENFQKSLTVCCAAHKYRWKLHHVKKRPYLHTIEKCWHLLWIKTLLNGLWQSGKLFPRKILWTIDRKKRGCCSVVNTALSELLRRVNGIEFQNEWIFFLQLSILKHLMPSLSLFLPWIKIWNKKRN